MENCLQCMVRFLSALLCKKKSHLAYGVWDCEGSCEKTLGNVISGVLGRGGGGEGEGGGSVFLVWEPMSCCLIKPGPVLFRPIQS